MINLRYHIVSLTAVFLAIGIGLTLGSTFLDRATVDTLESQLANLEEGLGNRDARIAELEAQIEASAAEHDALDTEGAALLTGRAEGVPVVVLTARGADDADVAEAMHTLQVAGADVRGAWWMSDRFALDDQGELDDLAEVVGMTTTDPAQLRRAAVDRFAAELTAHFQTAESDETTDDTTTDDTTTDDTTTDDTTVDDTVVDDEPTGDDPTTDDSSVDDPTADDPGDESNDGTEAESAIAGLFEAGFLEFEPATGGDEAPTLPAGARLIIVGGSGDVADDVVMVPLLERLADAATTPLPLLVTSARAGDGDGETSTAVTVVRQDDELRDRISTVDTVEHFSGRAAMVLSLIELGEARVGHYGVDEGSTQLLPPPGS